MGGIVTIGGDELMRSQRCRRCYGATLACGMINEASVHAYNAKARDCKGNLIKHRGMEMIKVKSNVMFSHTPKDSSLN